MDTPRVREPISRKFLLYVAGTLALAVTTAWPQYGAAQTQSYPSKPLHLIVGLPPGGGADLVARVFAGHLSESLGQQVVVESRVGSGGLIAADSAAKATPDGYTLLFGTVSTNAIFPSLYKKLPYDPVKDFSPVSLIATYPLVLVVNTKVPANSIGELIAYAKSNRGRLSYASAGYGTPLHLAMEMFKARAGIDVLHVPYKGGVQALSDLLSGEIQLIFDALPTQLANIRAGRVRPLAVTSKNRSPLLPNVPTMSEAGVSDFELMGWFAAFAPTGVSSSTLGTLNASIVEVLNAPGARQHLAELGVDPMSSTREELGAFQRSEIGKWARAVKESGASAD